jgi:hypothetical protein
MADCAICGPQALGLPPNAARSARIEIKLILITYSRDIGRG